MEGLNFAPCPPSAKANQPRIRVAVLKGSAIRLTLNLEAHEKFGRADALRVSTATDGEGRHFLRLESAKQGEGWPIAARKVDAKRGLPASCTIRKHPFEIGVVHPSHDVDITWGGDHALIAMPNWERMLDELELAE